MDRRRGAFAGNDVTYLNSDDGNVAVAAVETFDLDTHCASVVAVVVRFRVNWFAIDIVGAGLDVAYVNDVPAKRKQFNREKLIDLNESFRLI